LSECSLSLTSAVVTMNVAKHTLHWMLCAAALSLSWLPAVRETGRAVVRIAAANVNESGGRSGKVAYPCPPCPSFPAPSCEPSRFSERCLRPSLLLDQLSVQVLWIMAGVPASVFFFRDAAGRLIRQLGN
jgi:hypothetical protein